MATDQELAAFYKRHMAVGAKVVGGMTGALVSAAFSPFAGAALSPFLSSGLERVGNELIERRLAPRQGARVGRAVMMAAARLKERQEAGETPRNDGFFDADATTGRSESDEVLEAALSAAMNSAQEKKVDFIAVLLANVSFDETISPSSAHFLIETAGSLSYRSFVLLKIFGEMQSNGFPPRPDKTVAGPTPDLHPVMVEAFTLSRLSLIEKIDKNGSDDLITLLGWDDVDPCLMRLSPIGQILHDNLSLSSLPDTDPVYLKTREEFKRVSNSGDGPRNSLNITMDGGEF